MELLAGGHGARHPLAAPAATVRGILSKRRWLALPFNTGMWLASPQAHLAAAVGWRCHSTPDAQG